MSAARPLCSRDVCESHAQSVGVAQRVDPLPLARLIARHAFTSRPAFSLPWRWDAAVALIGLCELIDVCATSASELEHHVFDFASRHRTLEAMTMADHCVGAQACARIVGRRDSVEAHFAVHRVAQHLHHAPRNDAGVLDHLGHRAWYRYVYPRSLWVDSMMMYVATAHILGNKLDDPRLRELARSHGEVFCAHLQDNDGLFRHYCCLGRSTRSVRWLRGNGWAAMSLCTLVDPTRDDELRAAWWRLSEVLLNRQRDDGLWPTLLDEPRSPAEISGAALVACALARGARLGQLPRALDPLARDAAWRTWRGLQPWLRKTRHGLSVTGISAPTIPGPTFAYRWAPRLTDLGYGTGAVLMLATELAKEIVRP